ncbi:MAG: tRNA (adenosine(37)-N6)-threonylcarbamoyltransferase complex ATPase subunit type 1 TsaE [Clostridia bacterium]
MEIIVNNLKETKLLAQKVAKILTGNEIILLNGNLGAGKTTFTKFLAQAIGIKEPITSPTFTFMKEYHGKFALYHFDLYRVSEEEEVFELGLNSYLEEGICVIEWNKFEDLPKKPLIINIEYLEDNKRKFNLVNFTI